MRYLYLMLGICAVAGPSVGEDFIEINARLDAVSLKPTDNIPSIPEFPVQVDYFYQSHAKRDPFQAYYEVIKPEDMPVRQKAIPPDLLREKEPLELIDFPRFKLVGSLTNSGQSWALVSHTSGVVSKVAVGGRIGKNFGKVVKVSAKELVIKEKVSDGPGLWVSQYRSISAEEAK
tara:strand:- start:2512 stop:3036 length:525 start_codon:yes stop_codon:yes gene_type:complete